MVKKGLRTLVLKTLGQDLTMERMAERALAEYSSQKARQDDTLLTSKSTLSSLLVFLEGS